MRCANLTFGLVIALVMLQLGCQPETGYQTPPPPKVTVTQALVETIPIYIEENGETEAVEQSVVRAQVSGILKEIKFEPNSDVAEGTPLFVIDQEEYQAALLSAKATLNSAQAALEVAQAAVGEADARISASDASIKAAEAEFGRMQNLKNDNAISKSEFDTAEAALATAVAAKEGFVKAKVAAEAQVTNARAQIAKAEAELANVQLDLDRTVVHAPISGRITRSMVKRGNLVENGAAMIEIVAHDPIWANFNISERFLLNLERESGRKPDNSMDPTNVKVGLQRNGDVGFPFEGHLDYYAPTIDQDTGTLQLRAVFENKKEHGKKLLPGLFVRVRVQVGEYENALLIPERAINRDQAGTFVYIVDQDKKAVRKNITLGTKHEEMLVVESGLGPDDTVIVDGLQRVRPGVVVNPD